MLQVVADREAHTKADTVDNSTLKSAPVVSFAVIHSAVHVCRRYTLTTVFATMTLLGVRRRSAVSLWNARRKNYQRASHKSTAGARRTAKAVARVHVICNQPAERRTRSQPRQGEFTPPTCGETVVVPQLLDADAVEVLADDVQVEGL